MSLRSALLATLLTLALGVPAGAGAACGDADGSGTVTVTDGVAVLRAAAGLDPCPADRCDADGSGGVSLTDGVRVLRAAARLPAELTCGGNAPATRAEALASLTEVVILPGYRALDDAAAALTSAAVAFRDAPDAARLAALQAAWRAERAAWKQTEAFRLGPSEEFRTANRIDWSIAKRSALDVGKIENLVAGSSRLDVDAIESLGSNVVGSLAIEHLIFDPAGNDAALAALLATPRRRELAAAYAENVARQTARLRTAWEPDQGDFAAQFAQAGPGSDAFPTIKAAVDELVNRIVFTCETVEEQKLGAPLGIKAGGRPRPDLVESIRSGNAIEDVLNDLRGIEHLYLGTYAGQSGPGVGAVVLGLSPAVDTQTRALLADALAAVAAIPPPLDAAVESAEAAVQNAYERVQDLRRALVNDVASVLGVTLTFGGTDGD